MCPSGIEKNDEIVESLLLLQLTAAQYIGILVYIVQLFTLNNKIPLWNPSTASNAINTVRAGSQYVRE